MGGPGGEHVHAAQCYVDEADLVAKTDHVRRREVDQNDALLVKRLQGGGDVHTEDRGLIHWRRGAAAEPRVHRLFVVHGTDAPRRRAVRRLRADRQDRRDAREAQSLKLPHVAHPAAAQRLVPGELREELRYHDAPVLEVLHLEDQLRSGALRSREDPTGFGPGTLHRP